MESLSKSCTRCKAEKLTDLFRQFVRKGKTFFASWCKECTAAQAKESKKSPEAKAKAAAWQREWLKNPENRVKKSAYYKEWNKGESAKVAHRKRTVASRYGLSWEEYQAMFVAQDSKCAICYAGLIGSNVAVDHDHVTGAVRGLLCRGCNTAIGMMNESRSTLASAITYLAKHAGFAVIREAQ